MTATVVRLALGGALLAGSALSALAENPMVGGAAMFPEKNIIENAVNSADHTTLVAAVKAAGLVETLQGEGPFTVFAPDQRRLRGAARRDGRDAAEAGEQGPAGQGPDLPRGGRRRDVGRHRQDGRR